MSQRIQSIDALRGIAIFGMVFSAVIGYGSGLPAWMFHCQVPPPDYVFRPEVRGISWVDLVFPFFIFSMGAAFPLGLWKRLDQGKNVLPGILRRWITLVLFGLAIGNAGAVRHTDIALWAKLLLALAVWCGFFAALVRSERKWLNLTGLAFLIALFAFARLVLGAKLSLYRSDIIILILSAVALFGSLVWIVTRNSKGMRMVIWLAIYFVKLYSDRKGALVSLPIPQPLNAIFNWDWLQYLLVAIPGSIVGDMLLADRKNAGGTEAPVQKRNIATAGAVLSLAACALQLWGLFSRHITADIIATACLGAGFAALTWKRHDTPTAIARLGFALLLCGTLFDPLDGGIAKDYCNISYLLVSGGMAALVCSVLALAETRGRGFGFLGCCGQNPMIAYTITDFVLSPLLYAIGVLGLLDGLAEGSVFWGLARGVVVTALMCACTCFFTKKKLFWRS